MAPLAVVYGWSPNPLGMPFRAKMERADRQSWPRRNTVSHNAHAGTWAALGAVAALRAEQKNGPRQRALDGSPAVVRTQ